ncbi:MAG: rhodanese-like domain-containing protein [Planctomycetota bacterium]|nr:rhodanese-like domain-containing protein [Planctomycetota bacterium]
MSDAPASSGSAPAPGGRPTAPGLDARGLPVGYRLRDGWEVSPREVKAMIGRGEAFTLIDCRTPLENQIVKLPGSTLLPLQEAAGEPDALDEMKEKGRPVIVYCHHGVRSLQMAMFLRQQGVADAKSMAGGIDLWAIDVEPGMRRY